MNVNLINPLGGQAILNSFAKPSVKLVPGTKDQTAPMARREIVENQSQNVEANLGKIKALPDSEETREADTVQLMPAKAVTGRNIQRFGTMVIKTNVKSLRSSPSYGKTTLTRR